MRRRFGGSWLSCSTAKRGGRPGAGRMAAIFPFRNRTRSAGRVHSSKKRNAISPRRRSAVLTGGFNSKPQFRLCMPTGRAVNEQNGLRSCFSTNIWFAYLQRSVRDPAMLPPWPKRRVPRRAWRCWTRSTRIGFGLSGLLGGSCPPLAKTRENIASLGGFRSGDRLGTGPGGEKVPAPKTRLIKLLIRSVEINLLPPSTFIEAAKPIRLSPPGGEQCVHSVGQCWA